uniref:putative porin n=1 Tax=Veillonella parvula TaxID=29466 RepID=UPI00265CA1CE
AAKNLADRKEHGLNQRIRVGVDARINDNTNVRVVGSASGQSGVDSGHETEGSKGFNHQRLDELDVTHHESKWDYSIGRITESMGITGYWFNKEYDGLRSVWTNKNTQVRIGVGTFKHSTGISDSAYTHAIYTHFRRVPTVEEFLGVTMDSDGANKELIVPNAGNTINFYQQLKALRDKEGILDAEVGTLKKKIDDMTSDIWSKEFIDGMSADQLAPLKAELAKLEASLPDVEARVAKEREPLRAAQFDVLRRMQEIAVKAYGVDAAKQTVSIKMPDVSVTYSYKSRYYDEDDEQWYEDERTFTQKIAPGTIGLDKKNPLFEMKLSDTTVLSNGGKTFISNWYNQNKAAIVEAYRAKAKDIATYSFGNNPYMMKFEDNAFDGLDKSIYKANVVDINDSGTSGLINVKGSAYYPSMIASYFNSLARMLEKADGNSRLPREALGKYTGAVIPSIGVVLERDTIPPIEKATYVQVKHMVTPRLGLAAWYLRSFGGSDYRFYTANGNATEAHEFNNMANVFGVGAKYQLNHNVSVSFDYGQNRSDFGRFMNGNTHYDHKAGSSQFDIKGRDVGGVPHFWALRFDVGRADMNKPGSWNAYVDYKYFAHGSFFGGNGTEAVPDRYLDGIKSFTFGGGYVPTKDLLLQAFYTFDAKGINKRDTLYGSENFKLGNYTRFQMTYKF